MNSYHIKYKCLQELEEGILKPREAAKKYNVNNRTISRWKADAESIRQRVEEAPPGAKLTRKPRSDFKRKERPLTKEERKFKTFIEARGKLAKLRMADVIVKCQQVIPSSQGKRGHNLYMYVFRWLRRHNLMDYVAFNSTGRPKVHTSDEEDDELDYDMIDGADLLKDVNEDEPQHAFLRVNPAPTSPTQEDENKAQEPPANRSDEMSVIYALASLADGSGNKNNATESSANKDKEAPTAAPTEAPAAVEGEKPKDN